MHRAMIVPTYTACALLASISGDQSAWAQESPNAQQVAPQATQRELARETSLQFQDAPLSKVFTAIRAAETSGNEAVLDAIEACRTDELVRARIAFARNALRSRRALVSAKELVALEDALAVARLKLAAVVESTANGGALPQPVMAEALLAQSELMLEVAEDLLLNRFTADGSDAALAIGWLTSIEQANIAALLTSVEAILNDKHLREIRQRCNVASAIATDPAVFRLSVLDGIVQLAKADLARDTRASERDAFLRAAQVALSRAAQSELTIPTSVADILALARVRSEACTPLVARELLSRVKQSRDATLAWTAQVVAWVMASSDASKQAAAKTASARAELSAFPMIAQNSSAPAGGQRSVLEELAAISESRARLGFGQSSAECIEPIARYLRAASGETAASNEELSRRARRIAERIPTELRSAASATEAPPLLVALALLDGQGRVQPDALCDVAGAALRSAPQRASRDPLIAPWFTVPYASALFGLCVARDGAPIARDAATEATDALLFLVERAPPSPITRDAAIVAMDARRATLARVRSNIALREEAESAEAALDAALAIALARFPSDPERDAWTLARVDLALFPSSGHRDLNQAKRLLASLSRDARIKPLRDLRALEIDFAELEAAQPEDLAAQALGLVRIAELLDISLRPPAAQTDATAAAIARCDALRAAIALRAARPGEAMTIATRVFRRPLADQAAAARAAKTFVEAMLLREAAGAFDDATLEIPADLLAFAAETTVLRDALLSPIAAQRETLEGMLEGLLETRATEIAQRARKLSSLVALARAAPTAAPMALDAAAIVAATAEGDAPVAIKRARALRDRAPRDREAMWLLAQALMIDGDSAEARAEAFALSKELSPLADRTRDRIWWRAQLMQLEILSVDLTAQRATDVLARLNRLAAIDPQFGDTTNSGPLAQRFALVKKRALEVTRVPPPNDQRRNDVD